MRKVLIMMLLALSFLNADLVWQKDLNDATFVAKKNKKNIFVLVEGVHCRWCKLLKETTLNDPTMQTRLKKFVLVKILREDAPQYSLPPILGVPTMFIMTPDRSVMKEGVGYLETEDLIEIVDKFDREVKNKK